MEDVGVYSTVLQPRISRVDTSGFGSGGTEVWRDGCLSPFQNAYKASVHYVSGKMPEEMFVNSEGAYKVPLSLVLLSLSMILLTAPLVPLGLPLLATYGVWTVGWPRTGCDAILRLLGILLSWAPLALLIPLARMISTGQTLQLFEQEKISRVEVLGPFICCLLASLVFFSDVFLYIVERACAWMVWDEFAELEEKVFEVDEDVMEHPKLVDRVVHFLQQLRENIRVQSAVFNRSYVVQSEFERRILFALEGGDHRRWLENPPLHNHRNNESWRLSVGSIFAGLVQALLPSLSRLCLGVEEPLLCDSGILMFIRITYCVTAFATAAFVARHCIGTLMRLHTFQLRCLAVLYLVAPDKRRKALGWQYWSLMENLRLTLPTEESDTGHEDTPLTSHQSQRKLWLVDERRHTKMAEQDSFTQLLFACTDSMRYTLFFDDVRGQVDEEMEKVNSLERVHEVNTNISEISLRKNESVRATKPRRKSRRRRATVVGDDEQLLEEQPCPAHNKEVKILAARRFALLRIVTRANALVLQVHVEKLLSGILGVTVLYVTSEMLLVASEDSLTSASIVCLSNLLAIVALVFSILNKLVALNQMFREDTLKVLQSWKEKLDRLRFEVTLDMPIGSARTHMDSFFLSLLDPVTDMVDFIKNWQQPISLCGVEITSSKRNQVLVPMLSGVFYILGRALMQVNWASRLEVIAEQTAGVELGHLGIT